MTVIERRNKEKKEFESDSIQEGREAFDKALDQTSFGELLAMLGINVNQIEEDNLWNKLRDISKDSSDPEYWEEVSRLATDMNQIAKGYILQAQEHWQRELKPER